MVHSEEDGFDSLDLDGEEQAPKRGRKDSAPPKPRRFREQIEVKLSKTEWQGKCEEFAQAIEARDELAEAAAESAANFKAQIKLEDDRVDELKKQVSSHKAKLQVDLQERFIHAVGLVEIIRVDTDEKIRERPMTAAERAQPELPLS